jgi:hypothetical protein
MGQGLTILSLKRIEIQGVFYRSFTVSRGRHKPLLSDHHIIFQEDFPNDREVFLFSLGYSLR